jgi:hypothetical protein
MLLASSCFVFYLLLLVKIWMLLASSCFVFYLLLLVKIWMLLASSSPCTVLDAYSSRFTYRLDRLKPRASKFRGPPAKVHNIFNTVIWLSHLCCHNVLYFLNNGPSDFPYTVALHFRILPKFKHPSSSSSLLILIKHTSYFLQLWRWRIGRVLTSGIAYNSCIRVHRQQLKFNWLSLCLQRKIACIIVV